MIQYARPIQIGALLAATLAAAAPGAAQDLGAMTQNPSQWVMTGRTYDLNRYSPLTQITTANVTHLGSGVELLRRHAARTGRESAGHRQRDVRLVVVPE